MYIRALEAVSVSCFTTPLSRNRLPSISIPTSGAVVGRIRQTTMVIDDREQDLLQFGYRTKLLHLDLPLFLQWSEAFMIGGWMIGTRDI